MVFEGIPILEQGEDIVMGLGESVGLVQGEQESMDFADKFGDAASAPWYEPSPGAFQTGREAQMRQQYAAGREAAGQRVAPMAQAAQIQQAQQAQMRAAQMQALGTLQAQAEGRQVGPSTAGLLAQMQRDQGLQQAMAASAQRRGSSAGASIAGQGNIAAIQAGAQQRAEEQAAAQRGLQQLAAETRGQDIGLATSQAGMNQQVALANQQSQLKQQQMNDAQVAYFEQMGFNSEQAQAKALQAQEQMRAEQVMAQLNAQSALYSAEQQAEAQAKSSRLGLLGSLGGAALVAFSDRNLKKDIKREGKQLDEFMNSLKSYSGSYKNPDHGTDNRFMVMAQDVEKSKLGKDIVMNLAEGKALDLNKSVSAALSGLARLNERLNKVEGK